MIIPKANKLSTNELKEVEAIASDFECSILEIQGHNRCVYAILGDEEQRSYVQANCWTVFYFQGRYDRVALQIDGSTIWSGRSSSPSWQDRGW